MKKVILILVLIFLFAANSYAENYALQLNKATDYISVSDSNDWSFGTGNFTLEFWVNFSSLNVEQFFFMHREMTSSVSAWYLEITADNRLSFNAENNGSVGYYLTDPLPISTGEWHHIAFVRNGSTCLMFLDGVSLAVTAGTTFGEFPNPSSILEIGNFRLASAYVNGCLDEIRIWNRARTQQELNDSMLLALTGSEEGLIAYWNFNEGSGSIVYDLTSNHHNGQIMGPLYAVSNGPYGQTPIPNEPPIANAGDDISAKAGENVVLDGSASYDPDGSIVSYKWISLSDPTNPVIGTGVTFETIAHGYAEEIIQLKVTDNRGGSSTDIIKIINPGIEGPQGEPGITPEEVAVIENQIITLQQQNILLQQQNISQQQRIDEDRYLLQQLPQLQKKISEIESQVQ